jgi:hypothetical protein
MSEIAESIQQRQIPQNRGDTSTTEIPQNMQAIFSLKKT